MQIASIKKHIVVNEDQKPVAVMIDYQDWQKIMQILQSIENQDLADSS